MIRLHLPWPPSVNRYWRSNRGRVHISADGVDYRELVCGHVRLMRLQTLEGRLAVEIEARPPDNRRRDLDNALKATLDALQHAEVYADDSQIDDLRIWRGPVTKDGAMLFSVREIGDIDA